MDRVFEFLFKYRPVVFERGDVSFQPPWPLWALLLVVSIGALIALAPYARASAKLRLRDRVALSALRVLALGVLLFCLARPILVVAVVVPQQNFLGILVDNSQSMRIADPDRPRGQIATELFGPESPIVSALSERFKVRFFSFADGAKRIGTLHEVAFDGRRTDLARSLEDVKGELGSLPLAGLIVVTDGGHNTATPLDPALLGLKAGKVPVHVVGLGQERIDREVEVLRADVPTMVMAGSAVAVDVTVGHSGLAGQTVPIRVEDEGRIVGVGQVQLPRDGEAGTTRLNFTAETGGARRLRFVVPPLEGEKIVENNSLDRVVEVQSGRQKILYYEGEPRFEVKFLRRAIEGDENLQVVVLLRTAQDKYLRLDVSDSTELASGFPGTREELFRYKGLVLGSIEASSFPPDQLRMISDFVSRRGGGLLVLGGRNAFAEGGYTGTPLADALPVVIEGPPRGEDYDFFDEVKVVPTPAGSAHPALQLARGGKDPATLWDALPQLSILNPVTEVKPGATLLLEGRGGRGDTYVVLAHHRFGRGKALALLPQDTWMWQMHADVAPEDSTHEALWQQLLRWVVSDVPDPVSITATPDRVEPGTPITFVAQVADSTFLGVNGAEVTATVVAPSGAQESIPMGWTVERDGEYRATFVPKEEGMHEVRVAASRAGNSLGSGTTHMDAGDIGAEFRGPGMRAPLLRSLAEQTGGGFYTAETASRLPEDVSITEAGATVREERDLWDMPALFLLLLGLIGGEWAYRKRRGLP
ncbi:MAG: hypothetical protein HY701_06810 [Gemmatimonadetes bacterium]|nr:hypothetical protein [Gemmatimonadota bacterium]